MPSNDEIEAKEKEAEREQEKAVADGKPRHLTVEVTEHPKVRRNAEGEVTSATVIGKARFKGEVTLKFRGDVASAYWSVTPGMNLAVIAVEKDDKVYEAEHVDLLPQA